jgi:hypothetical protein
VKNPLPRIARCYNIYLPLKYNDGTEIGIEKYEEVENELLDQFGGVTSVRQENPLRGLWKSEESVYYDEIVVFTVIDLTFDRSDEGYRFFRNYKEILKERFQQEEILITAHVLEII